MTTTSQWNRSTSRESTGNGGSLRNRAPEEIEREIDKTRDAIGEDVRALQEKLSPEQLKEDARELVRESKDRAVEQVKTATNRTYERVAEGARAIGSSAGKLGRGTASFATANAAPLTLLGLGAGILLLSRRRSRASQHWYRPGEFEFERGLRSRGLVELEPGGITQPLSERAQNLASEVQESAREVVSEVQGTAQELGTAVESRAREAVLRARDRAGVMGNATRQSLARASDRTRIVISENPLAAILATLALGAGLSMLISGNAASSDFVQRIGHRIQGGARQALGQGRELARRLTNRASEHPIEALQAPIETIREEVLAVAPS